MSDVRQRYVQTKTAERRLLICQYLAGREDRTALSSDIRHMLFEKGEKISSASLRIDLAWLSDTACVITTVPVSTLTACILNATGMDVAHGRETIPGIGKA